MIALRSWSVKWVPSLILVWGLVGCAGPTAEQHPTRTTAAPKQSPRTCPRFAKLDSDQTDLVTVTGLADQQGAQGLVFRAARGGESGAQALAALPYAPDAELALGQLCDWLRSCPGASQLQLLKSVRGVIGARADTGGERLDVAGRRRCTDVLGGLEFEPGQLTARDLAASSRDLLLQSAPKAPPR